MASDRHQFDGPFPASGDPTVHRRADMTGPGQFNATPPPSLSLSELRRLAVQDASPADAGSPSAGAETCTCYHPTGCSICARRDPANHRVWCSAVPSPEDTVEPVETCEHPRGFMDYSGETRRYCPDCGDAEGQVLTTPPAVLTGEDDGADTLAADLRAVGIDPGTVGGARILRAGYAVINRHVAALPARPSVSGMDAALAATTQATVGVLTGHTTGCWCNRCEHLRLLGLPDAVQALVSGTANRDDALRHNLRELCDSAADGTVPVKWLLALLGGDQ